MSDSIKNLVKRIRYMNTKQSDKTVPASSIVHAGETYKFQGEPVEVTHTALRQLCSLAKIPADFYINRLTAEEQALVFNRLFSELGDAEFMFRFSKSTLYGIVSSRYQVIDDIELVPVLRQISNSGMDMKPVLSILEPEHTKIRLEMGGQWEDGIVPCVELQNSQVGIGSMRLLACVRRRVCSNGLLVNVYSTNSSWRHYGNGEVELPDLTIVFSVARNYTNRLKATIGKHIDLGMKVALLERIRLELGQKVADAFVEVANSRYRGGQDWFSVLNAITETAQRFTPLQQTRIEVFAGELLRGDAA